MNSTSTEANEWQGDLLGRRASADFLHQLVLQKMAGTDGKVADSDALCFALDSAWGTGKTFFLRRWANDLRGCDHPVIEFDAWENDLAEEPLVGFLAELRKGLIPWIQKVPVAKKAKLAAEKKLAEVLDRGRKAVLPAAGIALKSYLAKKFDIDEVIDVFKNGEATELDIEATKNAVSEGLGHLFERALDSHDETKQAVKDFKSSLSALLRHLEQHADASLPIFILVDELDRCRPDYAVRLLEGIKHLFDAPGVCFVISTNLVQMSESVRAVYGSGFDGYQYLKRFFAFEYQLPLPSRASYCKALALEHPALWSKRLAPGLPNAVLKEKDPPDIVALHLEKIGNSFDLSLRSLKQVAFIAEAATAGIKPTDKVFLLYLLMLAAILHKSPSAFRKITSFRLLADKFGEILRDIGYTDTTLKFSVSIQGHLTNQSVSLFSILHFYHEWAFEDLKTLQDKAYNNKNAHLYPQSLMTQVAEEMPNPYDSTRTYVPSLRNYSVLLSAAGHLSS